MADEVRGHSIGRVDYRDMGLWRSAAAAAAAASSHLRKFGLVGVSNVKGRLPKGGRKSIRRVPRHHRLPR
jgi:hypothetical protein